MGTRAFGVTAIVLLLATAGLASAQEASFEVSVQPSSTSASVDAGSSTSVSVDVNLRGDNFSCSGDEELPVNLTVASTRGVDGTGDPNPLIFSGTQGIHSSTAPTGPYNETQTADVTFSAASTASSGDRDMTVKGVFPGGNYGAQAGGSCEPGNFPSAEDTATVTVSVQGSTVGSTDNGTDGGTGGTTDGGDGGAGGTNSSDGGDGGNGIPIGPWVAPAALAAGALAIRRRN